MPIKLDFFFWRLNVANIQRYVNLDLRSERREHFQGAAVAEIISKPQIEISD